MELMWWHLFFLIPNLIFFGLLGFAWTRRRKKIALLLVMFCATAVPWTLSSFLGLISKDIDTKIFVLQIGHASISYAIVFWGIIVFEYLGWRRLTHIRFIIFFSIIPTIGVLLALTYPYHDLYWYDFDINQLDILEFKRGGLLILRNIYIYLYLSSVVILAFGRLLQTNQYFRTQVFLLMVAPIPAVFGNIAYVIGLTSGIDLTTFGLGLTALLISIGALGYDMLSTIPLARHDVISRIPIGMLTLDAQNYLIDINTMGAKIVGQSEKTLIRQNIFEFIEEPLKTTLATIQSRDKHEKYYENVEYRNAIYDIRITPLMDHKSELMGHVIIFIDITAQKKSEAVLAEKEKATREFQEYLQLLHQIRADLANYETLDEIYYQAILIGLNQLKFSRIGLRIIDPENEIVLGTYGTDAKGQIIDEHEFRKPVRDYDWMETALSSDSHTLSLNNIPLFDGNNYVKQGWSAKALLWHGNDAIGYISIDNMITNDAPRPYNMQLLSVYRTILAQTIARKRAEIEQQTLINELEAFAHTVAHDLKSPLGVINSLASLTMLENPELPEKIESFTSATYEISQKMFGIIDELLILAEMRHRQDVPLSAINMDSIVREAQHRLAPMIEETQAQIDLPDVWETALGYTPWIEQVWVNYLSNALKYGGNPPHIEIGVERLSEPYVKFWIKDHGPGIPQDELPTLFDTFTQLDKHQATGHGLGLSIVKRIIEKLGGEVGVISHLKQGSTFYFTLPAAETNNTHQSANKT